MDVSVENPGGLARRMKVEIPADRVTEAVDAKVRRVGQHARVPGFRPGKVPVKVLYQRYGESARQEAVGELVQSAYPEALQQAELKPAGQPELELGEVKAGEPLQFTASFDVYPEITLTGLDKISVEKPQTEITDADVDKTIDRIRDQNKTFSPVERESRDNDQVTVDYVGRIDGEAFDGGTGNDIEITLGEQKFLPELERSLVARKADEQYEVDVDFPADYGADELAGKTATFEVTLKSVAEPVLPELDEEFVQKLGIEEGGVDALKDKVRESLQQESRNAIDNRVKSQVLDALHAANRIEVPQSLVDQEIQRMRKEGMSRMPEFMQNDEEQARKLMPDDALRESAERRVALGLLIGEVIADQELELDNDRVQAKLDEVAADYGDQAQAVKQYYQTNPQLMQGLQAMVMEEQVVDALLEKATVTEKQVELDELLNGNGSGNAQDA